MTTPIDRDPGLARRGGYLNTKYTNILHEAEADGGWSGHLRVVVGTNRDDQDMLVFIDSDLLGPRRLVLTPQEAIALATKVTAMVAEVIPPYPWDLKSFQTVFGYPPPAEHAKTLAALRRHVRELSDRHDAAEQKRLSAPTATL